MTGPDLTSPRERYTMGYGATMHAFMGTRTAAEQADFLLPHLRPGQRLLDCGCGPGSITVGLAEAVAPGEVVGLDIEAAQIERARALAAERGLANARFETGDAYALPFPDASFDVVFAHALLQHLGEPARALREFRRVLRPGGLAAICDPDWSTWFLEPATPPLDRLPALWLRVYERNGGSPAYVRGLRGLLLAAGFAYAECQFLVTSYGTPAGTRRHARIHRDNLGVYSDDAIAHGLADAATIAALDAALAAWGERPDADAALTRGCGLGWVDGAGAAG